MTKQTKAHHNKNPLSAIHQMFSFGLQSIKKKYIQYYYELQFNT